MTEDLGTLFFKFKTDWGVVIMTKNEFIKYRYENYLKDVEQLLVIFHRDDMTYERFQELVEYARRFWLIEE